MKSSDYPTSAFLQKKFLPLETSSQEARCAYQKLTKSFERNSMYRGAMEPTWTSGWVPRGWGLLDSLTLGAMPNQNRLSSAVDPLLSKARPSAEYTVAAVQAVEHLKEKPDRLKQILFTVERPEQYKKNAALRWRSFMS